MKAKLIKIGKDLGALFVYGFVLGSGCLFASLAFSYIITTFFN